MATNSTCFEHPSAEKIPTFLSLDDPNPPVFTGFSKLMTKPAYVLNFVNYAFNSLNDGTSKIL